MSRVICINTFRRKKRKQYIDDNGDRLENFIQNFFRVHLATDFHSLTKEYLSSCANNQLSESWDYLDFREALREALANTIGQQILEELAKTRWFDEQVIGREEVIDRCLSLFILEDWAAIS